MTTSQGVPRIASNQQKLDERHRIISSSEHPEGTNLSTPLSQTSDVLNSE